jgi:putative protease
LSIDEIGRIRRHTDLPLEVFVHGALCVAYSGQCLTSESFGGRSANRGKCAQACRQPYELLVDGEPRDLGDKAYLLSPQDLAAHDLIADLAGLGVASVKIEGRLKSAHYVAATTRAYRAALDAVAENRPHTIDPEDDLALRQSFSRGFTHGFLDGVNHQELVQGRFPKHRGVRLGRVAAVEGETVLVELDAERANAPRPIDTAGGWDHVVKPGDGLVFDEGHPEQDEQGGRVFGVREVSAADRKGSAATGVLLSLSLGRGDINPAAVARGAIVWKTDDPALRKRLERASVVERSARSSPLSVELTGGPGLRLECRLRDEAGREVRVESAEPLEAARKHPLSLTLAREQWERLGGTPFVLGDLVLKSPSGEPCDELPVMAPKSVLNELRRRGVDELLAARRQTGLGRTVDVAALEGLRRRARDRINPSRPVSSTRDLFVLTRTAEQFAATVKWIVARREIEARQAETQPVCVAGVYCDFEDVRGYRAAVEAGRQAGVVVGLATPRVIKPGETGLLRQVGACEPELVLVRNLAALEFFRGGGVETGAKSVGKKLRLRGDYSLNVVNELTADLFLGEGLESITPGYDLNLDQLGTMLQAIDPSVCEVVLHQHMPMFHMEHCVFSHVLSDGTDWHSCGRPCDRHRVELRDHVGEAHPLVADVGCRNTVFNARPQSAGRFLPRLLEFGVRQYRVELLRESSVETAKLLDSYADLLSGRGTGPKLNRGLPVLEQLGVVGTLGYE